MPPTAAHLSSAMRFETGTAWRPRGTPRQGRPDRAGRRRRTRASVRFAAEAARSRERVRIGVQVCDRERPRNETGLVRRRLQPGATEEASPFDDVELAELGSDHPEHVKTL